MSVNSVILTQSGLPVMADMEKIYTTCTNVQLELISGAGFPGQKGNYFANSGTAYLTNRRLIYMPSTTNESFKSLSIPLHFIQTHTIEKEGIFAKTEIVQMLIKPTKVHVIPNAFMLERDANLKMYFHEKQSFEFHSSLVQLKSRPQDPSELPDYENLFNAEDVDPVPKYEGK